MILYFIQISPKYRLFLSNDLAYGKHTNETKVILTDIHSVQVSYFFTCKEHDKKYISCLIAQNLQENLAFPVYLHIILTYKI